MSRGPGRRQRILLDAIEQHGYTIVTSPDDTPSEQAAFRRAAYALEKAGKVTLVSRRIAGEASHPRLVAYRPGLGVWSGIRVTGFDGKIYRTPYLGNDGGWHCEPARYPLGRLRTDAVLTVRARASEDRR